MRNKSTLFLFIFIQLLLSIKTSYADETLIQRQTDSLLVLFDKAETDSMRAILSQEIGDVYYNTDPLFALNYSEMSLKISQKFLEKNQDNKFWLELKYKSLFDLGNTYGLLGDYEKSVESKMEALKTGEKAGMSENDLRGLIVNIGVSHQDQGNVEEALIYYRKGLEIAKKINNPYGLGMAYGNMGTIYNNFNPDSVIIFYRLALSYLQKVEEVDARVGGSAWLLQNIGSIFENNGEIDSAFSYYFKSLEMRESIDHHLGQYLVLRAIGELYNQTGNRSKALDFYNRSIKIGRKHNFKYGLENSYYQRSLIWKQNGNFKNAYEDLNTYIILFDSLQNEKSSKLIMKQTVKYEYDKKEALAKVEQEKKDAVAAKEKQLQKYYLFSVIGGLIILIVFLIGLYNRFTTIRKHNKIVNLQKMQLEEKQQKILDSIDYAKKIQTAVLPPKKMIKEYFNNSFVYYKPKDIVAGDFYWMEQVDGKILFAVADCTGHGVPGALVSIVCNNGLNRSVREYGLKKPSEILEKTNEIIISEFKKSEDDIKDGMDISLCLLDLEKKELQWAGANNPLWIVRGGKIFITPGDRQSIGFSNKPKPFTNHDVDIQSGDTIYIFSDGFKDQFGGENRKKFKSNNFISLLLSINDKEMDEQRNLIHKSFEEWKGGCEQVDDVCVLGIKV